MKTGFKEPTKDKAKTKTGFNPWTASAPPYDERTGEFVCQGNHHGVGYNNPVGKFSASNSGPIPYGRVNTMEVDEKA